MEKIKTADPSGKAAIAQFADVHSKTNTQSLKCALLMLRCWSFLAYTPKWLILPFLLLLHPPGTVYLLTFDCVKTLTFKCHLKTHLFKLT